MRRLTAITLTISLLAIVLASPAAGQSQADVDAARADARRAEQALSRAAAELLTAQLLESGLETSLLQTIEHFEQTATELSQVGLERLAVRAEIDAVGAEVSRLRISAAAAAAAAYQGAAVGRGAVWISRSFHGAALIGDALDRHLDRAAALVGELAVRRAELDAGRVTLGDQEQRLRDLRDQLDAAEVSLAAELGIAQEVVEAALAEVATADGAYRAALDRVELEERRVAALRGVEHWRPLVERYFPPERVAEALQVMQCESRGNPDATNPTSDAAGLFQFLETTWAFASVNAGFGGASRYDPEANVAAAAWLVSHSIAINHPRGAWGHWSCQPLSTPSGPA